MPVSVTGPIDQAFKSTGMILFRTGSFKKWLTLGFCAFLAYLGRGGGGNFNPGGGGGGPGGPGAPGPTPGQWITQNLTLLVAIAVVFLVLGVALAILLTWLSSRGQFMFMHGIVRNRGAVVIPWRRYAREANSLFRLRVCLALLFGFLWLLLIAVIAILVWPDLQTGRWGGASALGLTLGLAVGIPLAISTALISFTVYHFLTPAMFANSCTWSEAWVIVREDVIERNLGAACLFVGMRMLVALVIGILSFVLVFATCCIAAIPYVGSVIMLPLFVFERGYTLHFVAQFGERWQVFDVARWNCPVCDYDTEATDGVCPECGMAIDDMSEGSAPPDGIPPAPGAPAPAYDLSTAPLAQNDLVEVLEDVPLRGIRRGDVGIVTAVLSIPGVAYEVRFVDEAGVTTATATLMPDQVRRWNEDQA